MESNLEIIADEFGFDNVFKILFFNAVKILAKRRETKRRQGISEESLRQMYLTPYELAEQIYSKKQEIISSIGKPYNVQITISRKATEPQ